MNIIVRTNISNEYDNIEININAPKRTEELNQIENEILSISTNEVKQILAIHNNNVFLINASDIIKFYSEDKCNYCKTKDGTFVVKEKLYFLEEKLSKKDFIRISNSAIININHVKYFNTSIIGKIIVKFIDDTEEIVSRRRASDIMKFLKDRRNSL